jgi:glycosyltransferase involved in cell wall biosynthesis
MTIHPPRVMALLATHNTGERLSSTLKSLQDQTYANLTILISDDASTDHTAAMCRQAAETDARIRIMVQPKRRGWVGNINTLLEHAEGDYLFFMPHDDIVEPTYVEKLAAALDNNPDAAIAFCDITCFDHGQHREIQVYKELEGEKNRVRRAIRWLDQPTSGWCVPYRGLFRANTGKHVRGLRKNLAGEFGADWAWLLHMTLLGEFIRVPEILYRRNRGRHSLSESWCYRRREWMAVTLACGREVWRSGIPITEKFRLQQYIFATCRNIARNRFLK